MYEDQRLIKPVSPPRLTCSLFNMYLICLFQRLLNGIDRLMIGNLTAQMSRLIRVFIVLLPDNNKLTPA